jgi:tape measure domain-containing protein
MEILRTLGVAIDATGAKSGGAQASAAFNQVGQAAKDTEKAVNQSSQAVKATAAQMRQAVSSSSMLRSEMASQTSAVGRLNAAFWSTNTTLTGVGKRIGSFVGELMTMKNAIVATGLGLFAKDLIDTEIRVQGAANALRYASGTAQEFAKNQQFVRQVSNALGLDLLQTATDFSQLAAAAKGTALEGAGARNVLLATAKASAALHLSAAQTSQIIVAFYQMLGKGTVQAQELKLQLGNALPVAMQLAQKATGMTSAELEKMMATGNIVATEFLPKFAEEMDKAFSSDAAKNVNSVSSEVNRLKTAWMDLKSGIMEGPIGDVMVASLVKLKDFLHDLAPLVTGIGEELKAIQNWSTGGIDSAYISAHLNKLGVMAPPNPEADKRGLAGTGHSSGITIPSMEDVTLSDSVRFTDAANQTRAHGLDLITMAQSQYAAQIAKTGRELSAVKDIGLAIEGAKVFVFDKAKIDGASEALGGLEAGAKSIADVNKNLTLVFGDIDEMSKQNIEQLQSMTDELDAFFSDLDEKSGTMTSQRSSRRGFQEKQTTTGSFFADMSKSAKLASADMSDMFAQAKAAGEDTVQAVTSGFTGFFDGIIDGTNLGMESFRKMTSSILSDIAKIIAQRAVIQPIVGAIMDTVDAYFNGASAGAPYGGASSVPIGTGIWHTGGIVGSGANVIRNVDASLFHHAPRFHNGLRPDEFPAILQRGEKVTPANQVGREGVVMSMPITVNVDGGKGGTPEQNKKFGTDLARQLEATIDQRIARALMPRGVLSSARA